MSTSRTKAPSDRVHQFECSSSRINSATSKHAAKNFPSFQRNEETSIPHKFSMLGLSHFRIVQEQKNKVEVQRINLHFPLFVQRKLQTSPLDLVSVLLFLRNSKLAYILRSCRRCNQQLISHCFFHDSSFK